MAGAVDCKVSWTPKGSTTSTDINDITRIQIRRGADTKNSKAELSIKNPNRLHIDETSPETSQVQFGFDDTIKIYASFDTVDTSQQNHLLFVGLITKIEVKGNSKKADIKLTLTDKTDLFFGKVKLAHFPIAQAASTTVLDLIQKVDNKFYSNSANYDIETTTISKAYVSVHKRIVDHIKAVSTPSYTGGTRNYVFYVDENDKFYWFQPTDAGSTTLNGAINSTDTSIVLTSGTDFPDRSGIISIGSEIIFYTSKSGNTLTVPSWGRGYAGSTAASHVDTSIVNKQLQISVGEASGGLNKVRSVRATKSTDDTINMIIMRLGKDLIGQDIIWYHYNVNTTTNKLRMKIVDWRWVSENYFKENLDATNALNGDWTPGVTFINDNMVLDATTDFSASGTVRVNGKIEEGGEYIEYASKSSPNLVIASEAKRGLLGSAVPNTQPDNAPVQEVTTLVAAGNGAYRTAVKTKGRDEADTWFKGEIEKWKLTITLDGVYLNPQETILITYKDIGLNNLPIRVKDLRHDIDSRGWTTTITAEEDEENR